MAAVPSESARIRFSRDAVGAASQCTGRAHAVRLRMPARAATADAARRADCAARYASALDAVRAATVQLNKLTDELSTP